MFPSAIGTAHNVRALGKLAQEEDKQRKTAQESNPASDEKRQPFRERAASLGKQILTPFRSSPKHKPRISKEDISGPLPLQWSPEEPVPLVPVTPIPSAPTPRSIVPPKSIRTPSATATPSLARSTTAPDRIEIPLLPAPENIRNDRQCHQWLSDPSYAHAYPTAALANSPPPLTPQDSFEEGYSAYEFLRESKREETEKKHRERGRVRREDRAPKYTPPATPSNSSSGRGVRTPRTQVPPGPPRHLPPPPPLTVVTQEHKQPDITIESAAGNKSRRRLRPAPLIVKRYETYAKRLSRISEASQEPELNQVRKSTQRLAASIFESPSVRSSSQESIPPEAPASMQSAQLQPPSVGTKGRAIQQAKEMEQLVAERAKRSGDEPPPYDFFELIGKGAYGRVFKGQNRATKGLVAIKIIDIDRVDYEEYTTKNLSDTLIEIKILQQLKDSRARPYVNIIEEARTVHNELWIVSEYASGGSVNTLMKPNLQQKRTGLEEKFIIPIARELALSLKYIHEAGVIHRDIKCNNILINEDGSVQLCDFGVSGALEPDISKRSTIVGTPFWMAPELQNEWAKEADPSSRIKPKEILYGSEIDIWAFGCTIYEMATGFPPFHEKNIFKLPEAGVPSLEGDQYSDELKDLISFVLEPNPLDRPTPDQILEHPYIADTTKMYPTVSLVQLLERYYNWESAGGSRASLFNPYGAQAPDPLAPEDEAGEEDWTFSTTEEFAKHMSGIFPDPFAGNISENDFAFSQPPQDESRLAKLQASFREEQIDRGGKRLNRLFDQDSTPYRYSMLEPESGRPPSDLILRDFNPGAPNRETVIDLDFAAPTVVDVPSIDLGEVPTVKANRLNRLMREMEMEDEDQLLDMDQTDRRATREWKFPSMTEPEPEPMPEQDNRRTVDWKFPTMAEKSNRRTMEWTFDASMAESNAAQEPLPKLPRMPRRRDTQDLSLTTTNASVDQNRRTRDFVFPMRAPEEGDLSDLEFNFASSPTLSSGFRPTLRHATTEPMGSFNEYPQVKSAPESPVRFSMIDLDMANIDDYPRPSTSGSASTSTYTVGAENMNGNPFDLEDQVHLSQNNNRLSYHMKSQSEPNHAIPGLLTPQTTYDDQGVPTTQDPHHPAMHARGVSSVSQMQGKPPPNNITYRQRTQPSQPGWDGWNHHDAYHTDESSTPTSYSNSASPEDDQSVDELWDRLEQQSFAAPLRSGIRYPSGGYNRSRHAQSTSSDDDANYTSTDDYTTNIPTRLNVTTLHRQSRVSVGPNGRPLLEFPVPRGPDPEALLGVETDRGAMSTELLRATMEMRDGIRASRDLLRSMRLAEMRIDEE